VEGGLVTGRLFRALVDKAYGRSASTDLTTLHCADGEVLGVSVTPKARRTADASRSPLGQKFVFPPVTRLIQHIDRRSIF
jgi:hypothetical protein